MPNSLLRDVHTAILRHLVPSGTSVRVLPNRGSQILKDVATELGIKTPPEIGPSVVDGALVLTKLTFIQLVQEKAFSIIGTTEHGLRLENVIGGDFEETMESLQEQLGIDLSKVTPDRNGRVIDLVKAIVHQARLQFNDLFTELGLSATGENVGQAAMNAHTMQEPERIGHSAKDLSPEDAELAKKVADGLKSPGEIY
jgi:hypothetical protein